MKVRIVLADDHRIVREGVRSVLEQYEELEVVGEATDGEEAVSMARELTPDLILMDLFMPRLNGIEATRRITEESQGVHVLVLSMESGRHFVVDALKAGAGGYLLKDVGADELVTAIRTVVGGEHYLPARVTNMLLSEFIRRIPDQEDSRWELLTSRERHILQLVADGKSAKEIALALGVSQKTVDNHRISIMKKLSLHSIAELTKFAIREGLSSLN
jgi:DNA-binding NarL/FixJ family response regulator